MLRSYHRLSPTMDAPIRYINNDRIKTMQIKYSLLLIILVCIVASSCLQKKEGTDNIINDFEKKNAEIDYFTNGFDESKIKKDTILNAGLNLITKVFGQPQPVAEFFEYSDSSCYLLKTFNIAREVTKVNYGSDGVTEYCMYYYGQKQHETKIQYNASGQVEQIVKYKNIDGNLRLKTKERFLKKIR